MTHGALYRRSVISIISSLGFLLLYFLFIIILDLKIISNMLPPNSPFCLRISAHRSLCRASHSSLLLVASHCFLL